MPFRQKLWRAFLRIPCGHGESQFKRDEPRVIPPSRVCSPQIEQSASAPSIPRARRTSNSRETPSNPPRASTPASVGRVVERRNNGGPPEVKRLSAIGPDDVQNQESVLDPRHDRDPELIRGVEYDDNSELVPGYDRHSEPAHSHVRGPEPVHGCEQISEPTLDGGDLYQPISSPVNELHLSHISSQTSDYSNHSITHSLYPTSRPTSHSYSHVQGVDIAGKNEPLVKPVAESQSTKSFPTTEGGDDTSSLTLSGRNKPALYGGNTSPRPRQPLETIPSFVSSNRANADKTTEEVEQEWEEEEGEEGYTHWVLRANEITQRKSLEGPHLHPTRKGSVTTTIRSRSLDPIIHTRIQPIEREEVTTIITREIHHYDIYPIIQPIVETERLPTRHYLETTDGTLIEISAEDAEKEGWDEVWRGDFVVGNGSSETRDSESGPELEIEEVESRLDSLSMGRDKAAVFKVPEAPEAPEVRYGQ